jgi:hypothetical protein
MKAFCGVCAYKEHEDEIRSWADVQCLHKNGKIFIPTKGDFYDPPSGGFANRKCSERNTDNNCADFKAISRIRKYLRDFSEGKIW